MSKIKKKKDPFAAREAAKYAKPVPSREYILAHLHATNKPANLRELCEAFALNDEEDIEAVRRRLKAMLRDGQLESLSKRRYWPTGRHILVHGTVFIDKKNTLWVIPDDRSARISLPYFTDINVMPGNTVIVSVPDINPSDNSKPREGKIVEILSQPNMVVTGRYVIENGLSFVIPFSKEFLQDVVIPAHATLGAKNGQIVVVEISSQHSNRSDPIGKIVEILGDERNKNVEIESSIRKYRLPYEWPIEVEKSIANMQEEVPQQAYANRTDIRHIPLVTIDGEDARDFDDAVFATPHERGWKLYVAIADVSYYVKPGSALDQEAYNRGNSVYFPTRVLPMLPEILSNGLCSLKPDVDRLCMVCEMVITKAGKLDTYKFYPAVMRSRARMTYNKVAKILDGDIDLREQYKTLVPDFENLADLYHVLRGERTKRGAIDFETVETTINFGQNGTIASINPVERNVAHKIIEECMLCANVATAKFLDKYKIPSLYRNHEGPLEEKLADLRVFLREIGLSLGTGKKKKAEPLDYGRLLEQIKDRKDSKMIQTVLLRSLCQAVYAPDNVGHFGLAYEAYTHFTSPIRRYPDLIVHRQIKTVLAGKWNEQIRAAGEKTQKLEEQLEEIAHHCSVTERRADDATRDVVMSLKCQYIKQHIGSVFDGVISGVTKFGLFVELVDYYVDGLVHIASIGQDYYVFDAIHHRLIGERTGVQYTLGMPVKVQVAKVNTDELKIDFNLISTKNGTNKHNSTSKKTDLVQTKQKRDRRKKVKSKKKDKKDKKVKKGYDKR